MSLAPKPPSATETNQEAYAPLSIFARQLSRKRVVLRLVRLAWPKDRNAPVGRSCFGSKVLASYAYTVGPESILANLHGPFHLGLAGRDKEAKTPAAAISRPGGL